MTSQFEYNTISNAEDEKRLGKILQQCFNSPPDESIQTYFQRIGRENFRSIHDSNQMIGGLAIIPQGQWFGGKCIPMGGIAAVGIAPEYRGSGAALELMRQTIRELYRRGIPLSTLYAATQRLYRQAGYEQGGSLCSWEMPTQSIMMRDRTLPMQAVNLDHHQLHNLYQQQAKLTNGYLQRHQVIWQEIVESSTYAYLIGEDQPEGYLMFKQQKVKDSDCIVVRDLVLLTPGAVRRFWTFIGDHRSQIEKVRWKHSLNVFFTLMLPEQTAKIVDLGRWMVRIVDVIAALKNRGYPQELVTELHLEVRDSLIVENNDKFTLKVAQGRGEITRGGRGELKLNVSGLSPLYTGLFTPQQLQLVGHLEATETALLSATQIFAGSSPWMSDFF
ncbi:GNAT family N-acetyltransferase [Gloeocapsopsis dulcis]|uniref:GNAT family N-acetyltransferase n=1 Tax=Gloeocapsopsis dulcis AAB1 = 1H9 TaxID=1433147 RepID=A0A6N8G0M4_9CHRO|nr:GNAT family N-acetyltransferase [Gloeocapsopsis dulcis]MUL38940.1 GNAT family N-acetyltransferase [Gloeocapsopsis dulcis AAB1 = 1H9]WNN90873.1 GNAT family N-acetyltransferase [Gloeocapsopsis dulcis]